MWAVARPFIDRAHKSRCATGDCFLEDIYGRVMTGQWSLWVAFHGREPVGAMIACDVQYERGAVVQIPYLAGDDFADWVHLIDDVAADACRRGFPEIELLARDGFGKALSEYGIEKKWSLFRMPTGAGE